MSLVTSGSQMSCGSNVDKNTPQKSNVHFQSSTTDQTQNKTLSQNPSKCILNREVEWELKYDSSDCDAIETEEKIADKEKHHKSRKNSLQNVIPDIKCPESGVSKKNKSSAVKRKNSAREKVLQMAEPKNTKKPKKPDMSSLSFLPNTGKIESLLPIVNFDRKKENVSSIQAKRNMSTTVCRIEKHLSVSSSMYDAFNGENTWVCVFCHKGSHHEGLGDLFGPYYIQNKIFQNGKRVNPVGSSSENLSQRTSADSSEVWMHEDCAISAPGISIYGQELIGVEEAISDAKERFCWHCSLDGATIGCIGRRCELVCHFSCVKDADCELDFERFCVLCAEHQLRRDFVNSRSCGR